MKKRAKWKGRKAPAIVFNQDLKSAAFVYGAALLLILLIAVIGRIL